MALLWREGAENLRGRGHMGHEFQSGEAAVEFVDDVLVLQLHVRVEVSGIVTATRADKSMGREHLELEGVSLVGHLRSRNRTASRGYRIRKVRFCSYFWSYERRIGA